MSNTRVESYGWCPEMGHRYINEVRKIRYLPIGVDEVSQVCFPGYINMDKIGYSDGQVERIYYITLDTGERHVISSYKILDSV